MTPAWRTLAVSALLAGLAAPAVADDGLARKRDAKLAEAWLKRAAWITDYDKALAEAKASGKPVFAYFTRSYAH